MAPFFVPHNRIARQPITHSCGYCKEIVLRMNFIPGEEDFNVTLPLNRYIEDCLWIAKDNGCPFFKTLFDPQALENYPRRSDFADSSVEEWVVRYHIRNAEGYSADIRSTNIEFNASYWRRGKSGDSEEPSLLMSLTSPPHPREVGIKPISLILAEGRPFELFLAEAGEVGDASPSWLPNPPYTNFGCRSFLQGLKAKLENCCNTHSNCMTVALGLSRPKRLVEIDVHSEICRVITVDKELQYAALSYCWGTAQRTLTSYNLAKLQLGVHRSYFSQSIQDAVKVVAELGFRYLWVDALCILQDDARDKNEEIQKMGDIYSGAIFTVAASSAATCRQGFLRGSPREAFRVGLTDAWGKSPRMSLMMVQSFQEPNNPLHSRCWTLQEAYFSTRYIHFGQYSVDFLCSSSVNYLANIDSPRRILGFNTTMKSQTATISTGDFWGSIVRSYSSRNITESSDKLVAMSAIARDVAKATGNLEPEHYLAGLWRQRLAKELLWAHKGPAQPRPAYRAPSWSWASVNGAVEPGKLDSVTALEILDAKTLWDSSIGPFSSVTSGYVIVKSRMKTMSQYTIDSDGKIQFLQHSGRLDSIDLGPFWLRALGLYWNRRPFDEIWLMEGARKFEDNSSYEFIYYTDIYFYGIGLILIRNLEDQTFQRIGSFTCEGSSSNSLAEWLEMWHHSERCTITIV